MEFEAFWFRLCTENPLLTKKEQRITVTVVEFKRLLKKSHEAGESDMSKFEKIFGTRKK